MTLTVGTQLGSLEITALLGKGGMGEVYRARFEAEVLKLRSRSCLTKFRGMPIALTGFNVKPKCWHR